jgi:antitoxin component YwqK of YwqJK toxin-antitoxin module
LGQLRSRGFYKRGKRTGKWTFWDTKGKITQKMNFNPSG